MIPPQGFRHAVDLLLKNRVRHLHVDAEQLALELVALAEDMKAPPEWAAWVIAEYERVLQRPAPVSLATLSATKAVVTERCDLFLVYVPEDRLPLAAPLAVELAKRRVKVGFSQYEVESEPALDSAMARGLHACVAGAVLVTPNFRGRGLAPPSPCDRLLVLGQLTSPPAQAEALALWLFKFNTKNANF
jgi:hypothetical protein